MRDYYYSTFTVNKWISVFHDFTELNHVIIDCLTFITDNKWVEIYAFVIMRDHLHIVWKLNGKKTIEEVGTSFKKFTGRKIVKLLKKIDLNYLEKNFTSPRLDRKFKFWKLDSKHYEMIHEDILIQKIIYIHRNPTKGDYKVCEKPEDYKYSSAKSYKLKSTRFKFLNLLK